MLLSHNNMLSLCFLDTETTGLDPSMCELLEVAAVKNPLSSSRTEFHMMVKPSCEIPIHATAINGITDDEVKFAPNKKIVLPKLRKFIDKSIVVGHNVLFDLKFVNEHSGGLFNGARYIDSMDLAQTYFDKELNRSYRQTDLEEYFNITNTGKHRALHDVSALFQIVDKMQKAKPEIELSLHIKRFKQ